MLEDIKILLGDAASNFNDDLINLCLNQSKTEIEVYCNRKMDAELDSIAEKITVIKLNRLNTEGFSGQSFSGVSENYIDGYPAEVLAVLNRKRKIKVV